jgi:hypothetical protein
MPRALRIAPSPSRVPRNRLIPVSRHEPSRRPRQWSRARGKRRRCRFRLLGHSLATRAAPDSRSIAGIRHRTGNPGPAQGRRIATVSQQPPQAEELGTAPKPPDTRGLDGTLPGIFPPLSRIDRTTLQYPVKHNHCELAYPLTLERQGTETENSAPVSQIGPLWFVHFAGRLRDPCAGITPRGCCLHGSPFPSRTPPGCKHSIPPSRRLAHPHIHPSHLHGNIRFLRRSPGIARSPNPQIRTVSAGPGAWPPAPSSATPN